MGLSSTRVQNGLPEDKWGKCHIMARDVTFDDSYPTGGETLPPSMFGMEAITGVSIIGYDADAAPYVVRYNHVTGKLMVFTSGGFTPEGEISAPSFTVTKGAILANTELGLSADAATATVNNNTIAATLELVDNTPVGVPVFTGDAVAAAALAEVANGTDLSDLTVRVVAYGWA